MGLHRLPIVLQNGIMVDRLSAHILMGEPGKGNNRIIINASKKSVTITFQDKDYIFLYPKPRSPGSHVAGICSLVYIAPRQNFKWKVPE